MNKFVIALIVAVIALTAVVDAAHAATTPPDMVKTPGAFASWCKEVGARKCLVEVLRQLGPDGTASRSTGIGQPVKTTAPEKSGAEQLVAWFLKMAGKVDTRKP